MNVNVKEIIRLLCSECMCKRSLDFQVNVERLGHVVTEAGARFSLSVSGAIYGCKSLSRRVLFRLEMLLEKLGISFRLEDFGWDSDNHERSAILVIN
ncbi:hypothetical protein VCHA53O466_50206 [Vibrio chagasii]|nr:hypothetical protein VCHA53O466_50206 [Vibrio chagasii]